MFVEHLIFVFESERANAVARANLVAPTVGIYNVGHGVAGLVHPIMWTALLFPRCAGFKFQITIVELSTNTP